MTGLRSRHGAKNHSGKEELSEAELTDMTWCEVRTSRKMRCGCSDMCILLGGVGEPLYSAGLLKKVNYCLQTKDTPNVHWRL